MATGPKNKLLNLIPVCLLLLLSCSVSTGKVTRQYRKENSSAYRFDGSISRKVLRNYLDRSIKMGYFLVPGNPEGYEFPYRQNDFRMIRNVGA